MITSIFGMLQAIGSAVASIFNWKIKVDQTPREQEIQQDRKEDDENKMAIDQFVDSGGNLDRVRQPTAQDPAGRGD